MISPVQSLKYEFFVPDVLLDGLNLPAEKKVPLTRPYLSLNPGGTTNFDAEEQDVDKIGWITEWPLMSIVNKHGRHDPACSYETIGPEGNRALSIRADDDRVHQWVYPEFYPHHDLPESCGHSKEVVLVGELRVDLGGPVEFRFYRQNQSIDNFQEVRYTITGDGPEKFEEFQLALPINKSSTGSYTFGFSVKGPAKIYIDNLRFEPS